MQTIEVQHGQSLFDISMQVYGNVDLGLIRLAVDNGLAITEEIQPGTNLLVNPDFAVASVRPVATGVEFTETKPEGDFNNDFSNDLS